MVIVLEKQAVGLLSQSFAKDVFYINGDSMVEAVDQQSMFNLIDNTAGNKVDFWLLTSDPFDQARFARRRNAEVLGLDNFYIKTPEDTILSKLRWAKLSGGREKQSTDATRVFEMQFDRLDIDYIKHWISQMALQTQWEQLISRADPY